MIVPWSTDAPIYHRPWAAISLIAGSILAFVLTIGMDEELLEPYVLIHGDGLHPIQWITSNFLHGSIKHLVGNLVFLWAFALIVEGKVGFFPFLAIFLGIGALQCGLEQAVMLGSDGGASLGNSAIVYSLMAMALVWAPKNELNCFWWFGWRSGLMDISILGFSLLYIALEVVMVLFWGGLVGVTPASAVLHLSGALVGFVVGTALLKLGWVDCEDWDLYAVLGRHEGKPKGSVPIKIQGPKADPKKKRGGRKRPVEEEVSDEDRAAAATRRLDSRLESGSVEEAFAAYDKSVRSVPGWMPPEPTWLALIQALLEVQDWHGGVIVMEDYLRRTSRPAPRVRLRLAQVLIKEQQRPAHALKVLGAIPLGTLPEKLEAAARSLRRQAEQMLEEGVLELEGEAW